MTIDERLEHLVGRHEALTERHEALTQTVEIIAGMQQETEKRMQRNESLMTQVLESMARLANIASNHEQRLDNLEKP